MGEEQKPNNVEPDTHPNLLKTIDSINSLIALSHTIRVFSVKWRLIRRRLEELGSGLAALAQSGRSNVGCDQTAAELVAVVYRTVHDCHELGSLCISGSYAGKLLMQSDLDKAVSRLDLIANKLSATGLHHTAAAAGGLELVVSRPPVGAAKEDMKFFAKDLLNRLKIGDCEIKKNALISLNELIAEDQKYVKIIVELDDFVLSLSSCLDSNDSTIQESAAMAIASISCFDSYKTSLVISGIVAQLVRALETGNSNTKFHSIRSLVRLTENGDNAWAFSAHGGVTILMNLCSKDYNRFELGFIGSCCRVLRNVVVVEEIKRFMIEDNAIPTFIELIKSGDESAQIGSIEFLQSLVSDDSESVRKFVISQGGARVLVRILDPVLSFSFKLRETALKAIENLCFNSVDCVNLLISYGFMNHLMYFLRKGDVPSQELAFKSGSKLISASEEASKSMGNAGFMEEFIKFLDSNNKSYEIREMAAEALCIMVTIPKNKKKFSSNDGNISVVLQLLDPKDGNLSNSKLLLSILLSISSCNHARKVMSHCKYVKNIERLAEAGVSDAKRIIRRLATNRFKTILNGLLHS